MSRHVQFYRVCAEHVAHTGYTPLCKSYMQSNSKFQSEISSLESNQVTYALLLAHNNQK